MPAKPVKIPVLKKQPPGKQKVAVSGGEKPADTLTLLEKKIEQFETLSEISAILSSTLNEQIIKERSIDAITKLMDAKTGSLLLVDGKSGELYFEVALGAKGKKVKSLRLKKGQGIAGWVIRHGKPLIVNDVSIDKRFFEIADRKSRFKTKSVLCVPVRIKGKIIGVLEAINKSQGDFTKDDRDLFVLFSNQVAIAIDNARLYSELREAFYATSAALADAIEKRDPYTGGHTKRVLGYSIAIGLELKLPSEDMEQLKLSAVLHDVGKIGVDDAILRKKGRLDDAEFMAMKAHPRLGEEILSKIPQLSKMVPGILYHHERVDGKGYPEGRKKDKIPMMARIISVADTYDAITTSRSYRDGLTKKFAIDELKRCSGTQFDAEVVQAFMRAYKKGEIDSVFKKGYHQQSTFSAVK